MTSSGRFRSVGAVLLGTALLGGCARAPDTSPIVVFAASSLTDAVTELRARFLELHPGASVTLNFAGSQVLRIQIDEGAPADVFLSADRGHLEALVERGLLTDTRSVARNTLVVAVPRDGGPVRSFEHLDRAERLVIGTPDVPVGAYTRRMLERAAMSRGAGFRDAVLGRVVSEETNVRLALAKVELGEADAAVVYRTDVAASERTRAVEIPEDAAVTVEYWMGRVVDAGPEVEAWLAFLDTRDAAAILERHGFLVG